MTSLQQEVYTLRKEGLVYSEIAQHLHKDIRHIKEICVKLGVAYTDEERERAVQLGREHLKESLLKRGRQQSKKILKVKQCCFCGSEFIPSSSCRRYCSSECREESRKKRHEGRRLEAVSYYDSSLSVSEIKEQLGVSATFIYAAWREAGLARRMSPNQRRVYELRMEGLCSTEIAERLGIRVDNVNRIARDIGKPFTDEERQRSKANLRNQYTKRTEAEKELYVNSFFNGDFSYVSGYVDCDSNVIIRCSACRYEFERSMVGIRHGNQTTCPECDRQKKQKKEREKQEKREKLSLEKEQRRLEKEQVRKLKIRAVSCVECGTLFQTTRPRALCCSPVCSKKHANRYSSHRKDKRIPKDKRIDRGITAKRLYVRDNGICWICGKGCNLNDYVVRKGIIICGDDYPSVDHIVPVCEGGADSWDNVMLAHRRCNSERYWKKHA